MNLNSVVLVIVLLFAAWLAGHAFHSFFQMLSKFAKEDHQLQ